MKNQISSQTPPAKRTLLTATFKGKSKLLDQVRSEIRVRHYSIRTERTYVDWVYRYIIFNKKRHPAETTPALIHDYIVKLTEAHFSWSWVGMNISVLRSVFDKLAGQNLTRTFITPKRKQTIPDILNRREIRDLLTAADTTRDQLLLGLLYGCGLKISELRHLTWGDIVNGHLHLTAATRAPRHLEIPSELLPVIDYGKARCPANDYIFQGRYGGASLSTRMIELIIRQARNKAGILKQVTAMTLRHSYAVHCLEDGISICKLQIALGHKYIKTTMKYNRCLLPPNLQSPLDTLKQKQRNPQKQRQTNLSRSTASPSEAEPSIFPQISVAALELPFSRPDPEPSSRFYQLFKTLITGRFLSRRRAGTRSG